MEQWEAVLHEFVVSPDPQPWIGMTRPRKMLTHERAQLTVGLVRLGYLKAAGLAHEHKSQMVMAMYAPTETGLVYWRTYIGPQRSRARRAYSTAERALAHGPRDVWDLTRVPWTHKLVQAL